MPGSNAFTGFSTSNGTWANKGYTFTDGTINTSVFFPAAGCHNNIALSLVGSSGFYWSAVPSKTKSNGCILYFRSGNVPPHDSHSRENGFSVRPVQSN